MSSHRIQGAEGLVAMLAIVMAWLLVSAGDNNYLRSMITLVGIYYLLAASLNIVMGLTDLVSFGQAAFFGIGAYAAALSAIHSNTGLVGGILVGIAISVMVAVVVASASVRISGVYFALATLAVAEILHVVVLNWSALTRGPLGLIVPADGRTLAWSRGELSREAMFPLVMTVALVATIAILALLRSDAGWRMTSTRENPELAASLGISPRRQRTLSFMLAGGLATVAGALYAFNYGIVTPEVAGVHYSALALLMVIFGGRGSLLGPMVGAVAFVMIPQYIGLEGTLGEVVFAAVLLAVVLLLPRGVVGSVVELVGRVGSRAVDQPRDAVEASRS